MNSEFTTRELAEHLDIEYAEASALCKLGVRLGQMQEVGKRPQPSGKGKPSTIFKTNVAVLQFDLNADWGTPPLLQEEKVA